MSSGIFKIGRNFDLETFESLILPYLEDRGLIVENKQNMDYGGQTYNNDVLISLQSESEDLKTEFNDALMHIYNTVYNGKGTPLNEDVLINKYHLITTLWDRNANGGEGEQVFIGNFETLGLYNDDDAANKLFVSVAEIECAKITKDIIEQYISQAKAFGKQLSSK